jgi:hypothetical protein|tara:strand:+ start:777 stop:1007 length:231 start_codon:yes stop_codon:yes gene_type:complete
MRDIMTGDTFRNYPALYRLIVLEKSLKLELLGMKHSRKSAYARAKQEYGFKGNREKVYNQLLDMKNETLKALKGEG